MSRTNSVAKLFKRINIPYTSSSPTGLIEANTVDPWSQAGKYALGWTYFCIILVVLVFTTRLYHFWTDKLRQALYKEERDQARTSVNNSPQTDQSSTQETITTSNTDNYFKNELNSIQVPTYQHSTSSIDNINDTLAFFRWIFYRPVPQYTGKWITLGLPSLAVTAILVIAATFVLLYCFLPQPLYWQSIRYGSPPVAIRAGMISIAMTPWIVATATKGNPISLITGISHERLGVLHRWGTYLCTILIVVHIVPFYVQPVWKDGGLAVFTNLISINGIVYGTGICVFVSFCCLVLGSLPPIRHHLHEFFLVLHIPLSFLHVALLFWHTQNSLHSWVYLYTTCAIWTLTYLLRAHKLNWLSLWRKSNWLCGEECAITLMFAGGSGITAVVSQLLSLVKRMRDGKAVTKRVLVVWALKDLKALEWFREELRICVESAPEGSVTCDFYVTGGKELQGANGGGDAGGGKTGLHDLENQRDIPGTSVPHSASVLQHSRVEGFVDEAIENRYATILRDETRCDFAASELVHAEGEDIITSLPKSKFSHSSLAPVYLPATRFSFIPLSNHPSLKRPYKPLRCT